LKNELVRAQEEVLRIQAVPLVIGQFLEPIDEHTGIVASTTGANYLVPILSTLDRELLKPSSSVALHRHSNALVQILPPEADSSISLLGEQERPDVTFADIGGLDIQKQEIREAVELPLTHFDLYSQIGIDPPRGVLLYGPPGTITLTRYWENNVGESSGKCNYSIIHSCQRVRVCSKVLGRRSPYG
jgi:26S proteasome regulatory subunit T3